MDGSNHSTHGSSTGPTATPAAATTGTPSHGQNPSAPTPPSPLPSEQPVTKFLSSVQVGILPTGAEGGPVDLDGEDKAQAEAEDQAEEAQAEAETDTDAASADAAECSGSASSDISADSEETLGVARASNEKENVADPLDEARTERVLRELFGR